MNNETEYNGEPIAELEIKCSYCGGYHSPEDPHMIDDHGNLI